MAPLQSLLRRIGVESVAVTIVVTCIDKVASVLLCLQASIILAYPGLEDNLSIHYSLKGEKDFLFHEVIGVLTNVVRSVYHPFL
jgi:hypothetical protein